jgi:hypothetical protein
VIHVRVGIAVAFTHSRCPTKALVPHLRALHAVHREAAEVRVGEAVDVAEREELGLPPSEAHLCELS